MGWIIVAILLYICGMFKEATLLREKGVVNHHIREAVPRTLVYFLWFLSLLMWPVTIGE